MEPSWMRGAAPMSKSTGQPKVRRRSPGEGTVYPYRDGHRGAMAWTVLTAPHTSASCPAGRQLRPATSSTTFAATCDSGRSGPARRCPPRPKRLLASGAVDPGQHGRAAAGGDDNFSLPRGSNARSVREQAQSALQGVPPWAVFVIRRLQPFGTDGWQFIGDGLIRLHAVTCESRPSSSPAASGRRYRH